MEIVFESGVFQCRCTYDERLTPKAAGFRWDNFHKIWYTRSPNIASKLPQFLTLSAQKALEKITITISDSIPVPHIPKGESLFDFQIRAYEFAISRNRSYLALDPGLGKTPIAAVIAASLWRTGGPLNSIYICPPFLARNTEAEFRKWAPGVPVRRYGSPLGFGKDGGVTIVPDTMLGKASGDIRRMKKYDLLFVDEAHRFKNDTAGRTQALFGKKGEDGIVSPFPRIVYLSGTPMPNRPMELFPVLNSSAPSTIDFLTKHGFGLKYCAAFQNQWGWDYSGVSNFEELVKKVHGTFMLRYRKADVMKELPEKTSAMVVLSDELPPKLTKLSQRILSKLDPEDLMSGVVSLKVGTEELHLSTYRKELGILKVDEAVNFIAGELEESQESFLIFAIHKEVIQELTASLEHFEPLVITGATPMAERHEIVKEFQENPKRRVFIGNIQAAGTGLTLTKATRVIFVEFSWVPADNDQASDRAHRISQKSNVFVQYLVYENSVDQAVIETVLRKKKVTDKI